MTIDIYVTAGTIQQVELDGKGKTTFVSVTPTSDFTVKFGKDSYIVLLPLDKDKKKVDETKQAKFGKLENSSFSVDERFKSVLTQVAITRTVVEIQCKFETVSQAKVVCLKIPATS